MPIFTINGADLDLPRNLALLDTNILIARADEADQYHLEATLFLDEQEEFVLAVAPPVIGEACSYLTGKLKRRDRAEWLLQWLLTPGTGIKILPAPHGTSEAEVNSHLSSDFAWISQYKLDYVDSLLMQMANIITNTCQYSPDLVIVTKDISDFLRCLQKGYAYRIHDISTSETY